MNLSNEGWEALQPALRKQIFKKNEFLLQEGEVCNSLFYLENGFCKSYYIMDGVVKNSGFFLENEIATNIISFGNGVPSEFNMIACEPLHVVIFDKSTLFQIAQKYPELETLGRHCIRSFAMKQQAFSDLLKLPSGQERYEQLEAKYPQIMQRVSLSQLASFLGVARETLSRIRKRRVVK